MKKIFLFLIILITPCYALDYSAYCSSDIPLKSASGVLMSTSGTNFLARKILQKEIASLLKKETNSKFKVYIDSFWGTNIARGEFSKFSAISKNYNDKNFSAQKVEINTICPYNKVSYKDDKLNFDTNIVLKYNAEIKENNLSEMLKQEARIIDDKIVFDYKVSAFGIKSKLRLSAGLVVKDNKIQLCDIELNNKSIKLSKYLSLLNLTNFSIDLDKNTKADIKVDDVKIKNSTVYLSGHAIIPHN